MWLALSIVIFCVYPREQPIGLTSCGLVAILYVSSASWALALPLTRYASGLIWMLALFVLSGINAIPALRDAFLVNPRGLGSLLRQAGAALVCPIFLVGSGQTVGIAALSLILGAITLLTSAGWAFIAKLDVPLQDPS